MYLLIEGDSEAMSLLRDRDSGIKGQETRT